jgi:hypothetical protein
MPTTRPSRRRDRARRTAGGCACALLLALLGGCIRAPDVVIVDRKTALEQQAAGAWPELSRELMQAGLEPGATAYTSSDLGANLAGGEIQALREAWRGLHADTDRIDGLLLRACIGEASDGTLVRTPAACRGRIDEAEVIRLVEGTNRSRRQIWRYLKSTAPRASDKAVRRAWRKRHLDTVICGGHVEDLPGHAGWGTKQCD